MPGEMVTREVAIKNTGKLRQQLVARQCVIDKKLALVGSSMEDTEKIATNGN